MAEIFLTGGTGFIGKRLLPKLAKGNKIFLLVRKQSVAAAEEIIKKEKLKNIQLVTGDLEDKNLGLSGKEAKQIFRKIDYVFHLAADYDLSHSPEKFFRTISGGTKTIRKLLKETPNLKAFIHVSTAYVVGVKEGRIFEGQLIKPKAFRNFYEEAKFETEVFLRKTKLPLVVIRPALVVGDSKTGEFDKVAKSGFYQMVRAIDKGLIVFYPGECEGFIPTVPVDWVAETIFKIGFNKKTIGKTFHLTDLEPMTARVLINSTSQLLGKRQPIFTIPAALFNFLPRGKIKNQFLMLNRKQTFDMTNTLRILGKESIAPPLHSYLKILINYYHQNLR